MDTRDPGKLERGTAKAIAGVWFWSQVSRDSGVKALCKELAGDKKRCIRKDDRNISFIYAWEEKWPFFLFFHFQGPPALPRFWEGNKATLCFVPLEIKDRLDSLEPLSTCASSTLQCIWPSQSTSLQSQVKHDHFLPLGPLEMWPG